MKRFSMTMVALTLAGSAVACGTAGSGGRGGEGSGQAGADGSGGTTGAVGADGQPVEDGDFTKRKIADVKAPVYLDEIDRTAQDAFRDGVKQVSAEAPDYKKALGHFKAAADQDPKFLEAFFNWGMVLERTGRPDEALTIYQKALEKNPGEASAQAYIAKIYLSKAREAQHKGKEAEQKDWLAKAKVLLDGLLAKEADNVAVNNAMALYYLFLEDLDTAERYVKEVLYVQPSNVTGLNTRGLINLKRGKYLIARWIFENKVLKEDPTSTEALTNLGYTYIKLDQRPLAMRFFTRALEADPENMAVRMNIAAMLLEHLDYATALEHYEKVLDAQPTNVEAKIGRCDAIFGLGGAATDKKAQYDTAIQCYFAYAKEVPARADLYKRIAETYQNKMQDYDKAVEYYELYGKHAKLTPEEADKNGQIVKTLKDIIASGGLKEAPEEPLPDGTLPEGGIAPEGGVAPEGGAAPDPAATPEG